MKRVVSLGLASTSLACASLGHAEDRGPYVDTFLTASVGRGLRFNNPYRLEKQLGTSAESVSLTAPYAELGGLALLGRPTGLQHGVGLRYTWALSGVSQSVVTPSYTALHRRHAFLFPFARLGLPVVQKPDPNVGLEGALGAFAMVRGALGVLGEVGASGFYGAATREVRATFIPIWYAQIGVAVNLEVLP